MGIYTFYKNLGTSSAKFSIAKYYENIPIFNPNEWDGVLDEDEKQIYIDNTSPKPLPTSFNEYESIEMFELFQVLQLCKNYYCL